MRQFLSAIVLLALTGSAMANTRTAVLVANDQGLPSDEPLHYTALDAIRFARVLQELGQFESQNIHVLTDQKAADLLQRLHSLSSEDQQHGLFVFYYSGHADAQALHMSGTTLSMETLLEHLQKIPADIRLGVLDACQSGAALAVKGVQRGPAFDVQIDDKSARGQVLISSSAADEKSYESETHRGALFSMQWIVGLRGAADRNRDARVTLSEAYTYAYSQTLRSTILAQGGPQHPTFRWDLSGRLDPVITYINTAARLTLRATDEASYFIFDKQEKNVIAELHLRSGEEQRLALAPGEYVVKRRGTKDLRVALVRLYSGGNKILYDRQMEEVPWVRLSQKGGLGSSWLTLKLGQYASTVGPTGIATGAIGLEWEQEHWLTAMEMNGSYGSQTHLELTTETGAFGPTVAFLYGLHIGPTALRFGPVAGILLFVHLPKGRPTSYSLTGVAGGRLRLDLNLWSNLSLFASGQLLGLIGRVEREQDIDGLRLGELALFPYGAYQIGARIGW